MKKFLLSLLMLITNFTLAYADDVSVVLNGTPLAFDQPPIITDSRTLVPMRAIFEALECNIKWNNDTKEITAQNADSTIQLTVGSTISYINDIEYILDVPPLIVNERTLVPVRFVAESLECEVDWIPENSTVVISKQLIDSDSNLYSPSENTNGKYMSTTGIPGNNEVYFFTAPIDVRNKDIVYFSMNRYPLKVRFVTAYDENMNVIEQSGAENTSEFNTDGISYITVTAQQSQAERLVISDNDEADIILPAEICVSSGKTVNIYNKNIISKNWDNYTFDWKCEIGTSSSDKYSITAGDSDVGTYELLLEVKSITGKTVHTASSVIKVIQNSLDAVSILPIGDSLTNNKKWLSFVTSDSANKVTFIGTRGKAPHNHEGRSGFGSNNYLTGKEYTFENEGIHPFWDGEKFNWNYYLANTGLQPDAVQIFLGTNGLSANPVSNANNIKSIVEYIHNDNPDIPIFIVNTMHRGTVYTKAGEPDNEAIATEHINIINLTEYLTEILKDKENVHMIPLYAVHDSNNNYSKKDSVHPTEAGSREIADIIYSTYCAFLA